MKRVDVDRVEPHRGDARQRCRPVRDRPGEGRKQIVDAQPFRHRPVSRGCAKDRRAKWHNAAKRHNAHGKHGDSRRLITVRRASSGPPHGIGRRSGETVPVPSVTGGIEHRNRKSATRSSRTAPRCACPGSASGPRHTFRRAEFRTAAGKGSDIPFPRTVSDRAVADSCPSNAGIVAPVPDLRYLNVKSGHAPSRTDTDRTLSATVMSGPAAAPRSAAVSGGTRFPARRHDRRAARRPRRTAWRRSGTPGATRSRTRSAPTSPAAR